ncbi:MAG: hypothetical protein PVF85_08150, partial [Anaerolineales bacterium]
MKGFFTRVRNAIADPTLQQALDNNALRRTRGQRKALEQLPDSAQIKERARAIRAETVNNLDQALQDFERSLLRNGFVVHHAR